MASVWDDPRFSSPGFSRSTGLKKRPRESITAENARDSIKKLLTIQEDDLCNSDKSTELPYLGLGRPWTRPEPDINYVGKRTVFELLYDWDDQFVEYLITGPKGIGKSTDFRAVAVTLTKWFAAEAGGEKERLVFLYAELLLIDVVSAIKNALRFTFLVDEVTGYGDWQQAQLDIGAIDSIDKAVAFVEQRKQQQKSEKFYFFVDGGERLDAMDYFGRATYKSQQRTEVGEALKKLLVMGSRVWWCASPTAQISQPAQSPPRFNYELRGFSESEYLRYSSNSFLAGISGTRLASIGYLTGFVPLFLEVLRTCCEQLAWELLESERQAVMSSRAETLRVKLARTRALQPTNEQIVLLLEEDEYWDAAITKFAQHNELKLVHQKAQNVVLKEEYTIDAAMARLDPTYVLDAQNGIYCSSYIKRVYMQEILAARKMVDSRQSLRGPAC